MIEIQVFRAEGKVISFEVNGHANFANYGNDIVCAAVSVIAQTAVGAMQEIIGACDYTIRDGYLRCSISKDISKEKKEAAAIIMESMIVGFYQIHKEYTQYVFIQVKEV